MVETLYGIMIVGASVNACCLVGSRRSRSVPAVASTILMLAAMTDVGFGVVGLSPLLWTVILIGWGMVSAALVRGHARRAGLGTEPRAQGQHMGGAIHLHHLLGLIVTASQLAVHTAMAPATLTATDLASSPHSVHAHPSSSLLLAIAAGAGVLFIAWSVVLLSAASRSWLERGNLVGMSAMTAAMGLMPFV